MEHGEEKFSVIRARTEGLPIENVKPDTRNLQLSNSATLGNAILSGRKKDGQRLVTFSNCHFISYIIDLEN